MKFFSGLTGMDGRRSGQPVRATAPMMESLETRQLLSAEWAAANLLAEPLPADTGAAAVYSVKAASIAQTQKAKKVQVPSIVGTYTGTYYDQEGYQAQVILKVTAQKNGWVQGRMYTGDLGGFDVSGSGTISSKGVILGLGGKSSTLSNGKLRGTVSADGKTITGTMSAYVMGFYSEGQIELTRTTKRVPDKFKTKCTKMLGNYAGTMSSYEFSDAIAVSITRQEGGNLWGWGSGAEVDSISLTGTILADNRFRLIGRSGKTTVELYGYVRKGGVLEGYVIHRTSADTDELSFRMKSR